MTDPSALPVASWYREAPMSRDITLCDPFRDGIALNPNQAPYDVEQAHGDGLEWMNEYGRYITWTVIYGMQDRAKDLGPTTGPLTYEGIVRQSAAYLYAVEGRVVRRRPEPYANTYDERIRQVIVPESAPAALPSLPISREDAVSPFDRAMYEAQRALDGERHTEKGAIGELVLGHMITWARFARIGEQMSHITGAGNAVLNTLRQKRPRVCISDFAPRTNLTRLLELTGCESPYAYLLRSPSMPENWLREDPAAILETCRIPGTER